MTQSVERFIVPRKLLQWEGDTARVWVVDQLSGTAVVKTVTLAVGEKERSDEQVEVQSGLLPTDKLISSGVESLRPGQRVTIASEER